ncbi:MAG: universal stress protein [Spirochaetia bacterium]|nr:universal stress protein [Spirochaetia bacterium]
MTEQLRSIRRKVIVEKERLKRELGVPALFSTAYGNVGSSIYYGIGATVAFALGATPVAIALAGLFFVLTVLTFAEASTMMPYAGGTAYFARKAFNESASFVTGWIDLLAYVSTIALSSMTAVYYLGHFFPFLKYPVPVTIGTHAFATDPHMLTVIVSMVIVIILMVINIRGVKEAASFNIFFAVIDIMTQGLIIIIGFIMAMNLDKITAYIKMGPEYWPTLRQFCFGVAIAMVAYTGIETIAQMAEEADDYKKKIPRAYMWLIAVVLVMSIGLPSIAVSVMDPPTIVHEWQTDTMAGIAYYMPDLHIFGTTIVLKNILGAWIAFLAVTILLMATNAGIMGASRLSYSMGQFRQIPAFVFKLHRKYNTPYVAIMLFSAASVALLAAGLFYKDIFLKLASLYSLSSVFIFTMAHVCLVVLRIKHPEMERPFKVGWNLKIAGKEIPITAVVGFLANATVWLVLITGDTWTRLIALTWVVIGFVGYWLYRKKYELPIHTEVTIERVVMGAYQPVDYYGIIVPTTGELEAAHIQTACKIALRDKSRILAMYVIEVPMTLPLDARMTAEKEKGEAALDQAEMIAKEYGVEIDTKLLQVRSAGKAIVEEAEKRRADLIMMGQTEKRGLSNLASGKTVSYVAQNAPCKVFINIAEKA